MKYAPGYEQKGREYLSKGNRLPEPWLIFQIGAREHYAIQRALSHAGVQSRLVTDCWTKPVNRTGSKIHSLLGKRLTGRSHPEVEPSDVTAFNRSLLWFTLCSRLRRLHDWPLIEARNQWFQQHSSKVLSQAVQGGELPVVFSYSYAAKNIFSKAKSLGCTTVLGQIDPGPKELHLVNQLYKEAGRELPPQPSSHYWENWHRECELADKIVVNSSWSFNALLEEGIAEEKLQILPLVYEEPAQCLEEGEEIANANRLRNQVPKQFTPARPLRVLFLGQVIVRKGVLPLIEAISKMEGQAVEWIIVGGGEQWLLDKLASQPQVRVCGQVSRSEAPEFYRKADLFILPTHSDGYAITQLEAAAYGLPIIASTSCGDVVRQGVTGEILESVTPVAIVSAVTKFLDCPESVKRYSANILHRERFGLSDLGERLVSFSKEQVTPQ